MTGLYRCAGDNVRIPFLFSVPDTALHVFLPSLLSSHFQHPSRRMIGCHSRR